MSSRTKWQKKKSTNNKKNLTQEKKDVLKTWQQILAESEKNFSNARTKAQMERLKFVVDVLDKELYLIHVAHKLNPNKLL